MIGFNFSFVSKRIKNSKESLIQKSSFDWISETLTEDTEWNLPATAYPVFVVKLRANIVGQQLPTLFDVTCCLRLQTPLHVVAQSLKPVKRLTPCKRTQHSLRPTTANKVGRCCVRLHVALHVNRFFFLWFEFLLEELNFLGFIFREDFYSRGLL